MPKKQAALHVEPQIFLSDLTNTVCTDKLQLAPSNMIFHNKVNQSCYRPRVAQRVPGS